MASTRVLPRLESTFFRAPLLLSPAIDWHHRIVSLSPDSLPLATWHCTTQHPIQTSIPIEIAIHIGTLKLKLKPRPMPSQFQVRRQIQVNWPGGENVLSREQESRDTGKARSAVAAKVAVTTTTITQTTTGSSQ